MLTLSGLESMLPRNRWRVRLMVPDRQEEAARLSNHSHGRQPTNDHIPRPLTPHRFYVQLNDDDFFMLVILRSFHTALKEWLKIPLPRCMPLMACHHCDEWMKVTTHGDEMVLE